MVIFYKTSLNCIISTHTHTPLQILRLALPRASATTLMTTRPTCTTPSASSTSASVSSTPAPMDASPAPLSAALRSSSPLSSSVGEKAKVGVVYYFQPARLQMHKKLSNLGYLLYAVKYQTDHIAFLAPTGALYVMMLKANPLFEIYANKHTGCFF